MLQIVTTQLSLSTTTQTQTGLLICSLSLLIWNHLPGHCLCFSSQQGRWLDCSSKNSRKTPQSPEPASTLHHFALLFLNPVLCLLINTCCFWIASRIESKSLASDFSTLFTTTLPQATCVSVTLHHFTPKKVLWSQISKPLCICMRCALWNTFIGSPLFSTSPTPTIL